MNTEKLMKKKHSKIAHLSDEQIDELIERYYSEETVSKLLEEYGINIRPSEFVKILPPIIHEDVICQYCNSPMWSDLPSKTAMSTGYGAKPKKYCPSCNHQDDTICFCDSCNEQREMQKEQELEEKKELIGKYVNIENDTPVEFESLDYLQKIYLGAFLRAGISEDLSYIIPINEFQSPLTPSIELFDEIFNVLYRESGVIQIHPKSPISAFDIDDEENITFNSSKVYWHLNITSSDDMSVTIEKLMNPEKDEFNDHNMNYEIWNKIALAECIEYLLYSMNSANFSFNPGDKTKQVFSDLLRNFSTAQIYSIIFKQTNNALRFHEEKKVARNHAANSVITGCRTYGETAKIKKWDLPKYYRIAECPQSEISNFFFNRVMQIGDDGFFCKPRVIDFKVNEISPTTTTKKKKKKKNNRKKKK